VDPEELTETVRTAASGDPAAWATLVRRYTGLVWAVARSFRLDRFDAEDVAQTVWERLAHSLGDLREPQHVGAWLATTTRREALRVLEVRAKTLPSGDLSWARTDRADDTTPETLVVDEYEAAERDAHARRAWRAMRLLSEGCQQLLRVLMASPPPSYSEAAAALGRPIGYIGPSRRRCLDQLAGLLGGDVSRAQEPAHD
jgi:RNA polymerase sigma factor (sigma-70 family)